MFLKSIANGKITAAVDTLRASPARHTPTSLTRLFSANNAIAWLNPGLTALVLRVDFTEEKVDFN